MPSRRLTLGGARLGRSGPHVDITVAAGRIAAIRPHGSTSRNRTDGDEFVSVDGATALRGLWDRHVHSRQWALRRHGLDVSGTRTAREVAARVQSAAGTGLLLAFGAREAGWPDAPHRDLLSAIERPVLVQTADLHTAWLNPAALVLAGAPAHPSGVLREQECFSAVAALTAAVGPQVEGWVMDAMADAARRGVVGILDFEMADNVSDWQRRAATTPLPLRVICSVPRAAVDSAVATGLRTGAALGDPMLTVGPVKVFADGSLGSRTAWCHAPYPGGDCAGRHEISESELQGLIAYAAAHGLSVAVHAIGDRANTAALDAFEHAGATGRIEHAQLVSPADIARFGRLGVVAGVQPGHQIDDRDAADDQWRGRTEHAYPYGELHRAGARLEFGSDAPVGPLDPWPAIAAAVTRTGDGRAPWHPGQALSLDVALDCSTGGRATPRAGDDADLILLDPDFGTAPGPGGADYDRLAATPVHGTLVAGRWTHQV